MAKKHRKKIKEYSSPYERFWEEEGRESDYRSKLVQDINPPKPKSEVQKDKYIYKTKKDIEHVICIWKNNHMNVTIDMINRVISKISAPNIYDYFKKRIKELQKTYGVKKTSTTYTKNELHSKKNDKNKHHNTISSYAVSKQIVCIHPSKKKPKYGYARDYFGRIQERDHYIENRPINPHQDYSNYDSEDDNDSMYDGFK